MPRLYAEVWTRPGDPSYGRRIADAPISEGSATIGHSGVGQGSMTLPKVYVRLDDILHTDPDTPASGVTSTIKIFSDSQATPVYEWLAGDRIPAQSKDDPNVVVSGDGIEALAGYGMVEPWDWDGSANWQPTLPDWIYGGRNLLTNPGFEDSSCRPEVNQIALDPTVTGGTFTLSDGTDTTSAIAWNASAFTIETELEADIAAIDDVNVTGSGTEADPWVITFVSPCVFAGGLTFNGASLTPAPGDSALIRTQFGALQPNPWTKSKVESSGTDRIFGGYDSFRVTDTEAHTGTYSLLIDPSLIGRRFAGAQQVINVDAGGIYQASIWVKTNSAGQEYRFVIRGIDEDYIASTQATLTSGVWTQFSIPNVAVGDNTQIIVRIANINVSGDPAIFYVDDGEFNEGQPPATVGLMWGDMYAAWIDPVLRSPIVWDDGSATDTPYLTNDFSDTLDSAGQAWSDTHSLTFRPRMSGLQVLGEFVRLGYEWRVVADAAPGYYLLQIYNPGTLGGVVAAGIQAGSADIRRNARYLAPRATQVTVQGQGFLSSRAQNNNLISAFGRIEGPLLDLNITSSTDAATAAVDGVASNNQGASSLVYTLRPYPGISEPLVAYRPGDEITVVDPGVVAGQRRVSQVELAWDKTGAEYTIYLGSVALIGQNSVNQAVYDLLRKFERADEIPASAAVALGGGSGGMAHVLIVSTSEPESVQQKADYVVNETNAAVELQAIFDTLPSNDWSIWMAGVFSLNQDVTTPSGAWIRGLGYSTGGG